MNPQGLIPMVLGAALIALGINGKYRNAWAVITGQGASEKRTP